MMKADKSLDLYMSGGSDEEQRDYLNSFREKIAGILLKLNLRETKEYICCTVNGKEGKVAYKDVEFAHKSGRKEILIPGIQEYVPLTNLLNLVDHHSEVVKTNPISSPGPEKPSWTEKMKNDISAAPLVFKFLLGLILVITRVITLKDWFLLLHGK